jgi:2-polyprenyl-3-methyl-5-hydroxy-6-metoxy-1,4-benzoquinol methylase
MTGTAPNCPICQTRDATELETWTDPIENRDYRILRCPDCTLAFAEPLRFPGGEWYEKYNYLGGTDEDSFTWSAYRVDFLLERLPVKNGRLLDIGCGAGHLLGRAAAAGFTTDGLEVDRRLAQRAREHASGDVFEGILDENFAEKHAGKYDAVSLFDVLEHLEDPQKMIQRLKRLLKPKGCLLISVPNDLRPLLNGRDGWDYPPHHLTRWTPEAMARLLLPAGFHLRELNASLITVFMFSRIWADRSAAWLLRLFKRLAYGKGAADKNMETLIAESSTEKATALPDKSRRLKWVARYHLLFHCLSFPYFGTKALYYRLTRKNGGNSLLVLAQCR